MLERFYMDLPRDRTWDVVEDLSEIELAAYFWKYSVASYGWKGLNFIGKGNGYFSDAMRDHSDVLSVVEYLSIPKEDVLAYEFRAAEAFRPSYFITRDRPTNSIVLCIRGTMVSKGLMGERLEMDQTNSQWSMIECIRYHDRSCLRIRTMAWRSCA